MENNSYQLRYLPLFEQDLIGVVNYITNVLKNEDAALRLINDVEAAILKRLDNPLSYEPYPSTKKRNYPYRSAVHSPSLSSPVTSFQNCSPLRVTSRAGGIFVSSYRSDCYGLSAPVRVAALARVFSLCDCKPAACAGLTILFVNLRQCRFQGLSVKPAAHQCFPPDNKRPDL